jgi:hypothetical protein
VWSGKTVVGTLVVEDMLMIAEEEVEDYKELEVVVTENRSRFDGAGARKVSSVRSG